MGAAFLQYKKKMKGSKLSDGKNVGGAESLTEDIIQGIQNYFGFAIRHNVGNLEGMKTAIDAIQHSNFK